VPNFRHSAKPLAHGIERVSGSDRNKGNIKVVVVDEIYNFVVDNIFI